MNLKKGVHITTQGKSMVFITRYFKVMNSLPVAIVSLYTRLLLLCFDTSFRFVYQYHGGLVFLFCFCRIKAKKQTDLIMFYPPGNKAFFFSGVWATLKNWREAQCVSASQSVSGSSWRLESDSVFFPAPIPGHRGMSLCWQCAACSFGLGMLLVQLKKQLLVCQRDLCHRT